jgi:hypothetical protein
MTQDENARYGFLVETYETERLKVLSVWTAFEDADLPAGPIRRIGGGGASSSTWCTSA